MSVATRISVVRHEFAAGRYHDCGQAARVAVPDLASEVLVAVIRSGPTTWAEGESARRRCRGRRSACLRDRCLAEQPRGGVAWRLVVAIDPQVCAPHQLDRE